MKRCASGSDRAFEIDARRTILETDESQLPPKVHSRPRFNTGLYPL